jgi:hypothetical protein
MQGNNPAFSRLYAKISVKLNKYSVYLYIYTKNICIFVAKINHLG